jgi:aryl-alcohol dehydrogenase-like predicted oxidoreductase
LDYIKIKGLDQLASALVLGTAWGDPDDQAHFDAMLEAYLEHGGSVIDCGRFYGAECAAEVALRRWLERSGKRERVIIIDKCCHPYTFRDKSQDISRPRVSAEFITEDLTFSLDRVGTDYFDLYLMHRDDLSVPVAGLMDRLEQHCREGRIKAYGVSNWSLPRIRESVGYCARMGYQGPSADSPSFSLATVDRPRWRNTVYIGDAEAARRAELDLPVFSWAAQASGFFSGTYHEDNAPDFMRETYFSEINFEKLRRAEALAKKHGADSINIALAYVLSQPFPVAAVVGPASVDELLSCCRASKLKLSGPELDYLSLRRDNIP